MAARLSLTGLCRLSEFVCHLRMQSKLPHILAVSKIRRLELANRSALEQTLHRCSGHRHPELYNFEGGSPTPRARDLRRVR